MDELRFPSRIERGPLFEILLKEIKHNGLRQDLTVYDDGRAYVFSPSWPNGYYAWWFDKKGKIGVKKLTQEEWELTTDTKFLKLNSEYIAGCFHKLNDSDRFKVLTLFRELKGYEPTMTSIMTAWAVKGVERTLQLWVRPYTTEGA